MFQIHRNKIQSDRQTTRGFTLIELMIVIAIIAIILTLALPVYSNYTIRAKVGEALSVAAAAKTLVADTCQGDPTIAGLTAANTGVDVTPTTYVESIVVSGPCTVPVLTMTTRNTGATTSPVLILTGDLSSLSGRMAWNCTAVGEKIHVPRTCRGS